MRYLTVNRLRKAEACDYGIRQFQKKYGSRVAVTAENVRAADVPGGNLHSLSDLFKLNYCPCEKDFKPAMFARKLTRALSK